jgi:hypothetical protein
MRRYHVDGLTDYLAETKFEGLAAHYIGMNSDTRHKLAKDTTINWPRMPALVELFDHFRSLCSDKVAASPALQA